MGSIIKVMMFKATFLTISLLLALAAVISAEDNVPLIQTAMDVLARATSSSQVLSFNLTGVIILIVLKIAVIAYTMLSGGVTGRSGLYNPPGYSPADLTGGMCFLPYTNGDEDKLNCLSRAVCESPEVGSNYLAAAKLWYKMHKLISAVPYSEKYTTVVEALNSANSLGLEGGDCSRFSW